MNATPRMSVPTLITNHLYVGVIITLFYVWISPFIINAGLPSMTVLLAAEVLILAPLVSGHLWLVARHNSTAIKNVIQFKEQLPYRSLIIYTLLGILACIIVYAPLYPVGIFIRQNWFTWLPEWYFNPSYGAANTKLIANTFLIGALIDGLIGPIAEEFFFRGYLLPKMGSLKNWAPVVNGALFGVYHFWQPHNMLATIAIGIILSFAAWKTRNVYVAIIIHCSLNMIGAIGGFIAASGEIEIVR